MKNKLKVKSIKAKGLKKILLPFCFLFVFCIQIFSQTSTDFLILSEKIRNGSDEEKRDILFQMRNLQTEQASRLAIPALQDSSEIVRATATNSVVFLPPNEAVQLLIPLLSDKSILVRRETAYALGKTGNPQAVNSLLQILQKDKELEVKSAAVIALGQIGDVSAVETLTNILQKKPEKKDEFLRRSAVRSIGNIARSQQTKKKVKIEIKKLYNPDKEIKSQSLIEKFPIFQKTNEVLISVLQNKKSASDTKREAAFALGEIGDEESIRALQTNLSSEDYYLVEILENSLLKIREVSKNETKSLN